MPGNVITRFKQDFYRARFCNEILATSFQRNTDGISGISWHRGIVKVLRKITVAWRQKCLVR